MRAMRETNAMPPLQWKWESASASCQKLERRHSASRREVGPTKVDSLSTSKRRGCKAWVWNPTAWMALTRRRKCWSRATASSTMQMRNQSRTASLSRAPHTPCARMALSSEAQ